MCVTTEIGARIVQLFVEGMSVRSVERIPRVHRDTIIRTLRTVDRGCERMSAQTIAKLRVRDVECDEMWGFVGCKEKNVTDEHPSGFGGGYRFVGIERDTKLVLAWHVGRRTSPDTYAFIEKLDVATEGRFQITTEGFAGYPEAIDLNLGTRVDYAQLIKVCMPRHAMENRDTHHQKLSMQSQCPDSEGQIASAYRIRVSRDKI